MQANRDSAASQLEAEIEAEQAHADALARDADAADTRIRALGALSQDALRKHEGRKNDEAFLSGELKKVQRKLAKFEAVNRKAGHEFDSFKQSEDQLVARREVRLICLQLLHIHCWCGCSSMATRSWLHGARCGVWR